MTNMDVNSFVNKQLQLIELERDADIEETRCLHENTSTKELEQQGVCIRKLIVQEKKSGLYGRTLIKFGPQWVEKGLPSHHISSGDIVGISNYGEYVHQNVIISGVVLSVKAVRITVAFEMTIENIDLEDSKVYCLVKLANDVTYKRIKNALLQLKKTSESSCSHLIDVLYGSVSVGEPLPSQENRLIGEIKFYDQSLNDPQRESVKFALAQREIAIIHGPPGTGKTTTLVEIIRQFVSQKLKVLVSAPSNVAVDNLAEKLALTEVKFVRLGHPARTSLVNQKATLDAMLHRCDNAKIIEDIRKELDSVSLNVKNATHKGDQHKRRTEIRELTRELRNREVAALTEVLKGVNVVLATLVSSYPGGPLKHLPKGYFDVVVIDECSQALECACLIPLLLAKKCVLAGDHKQLPPTIISEKAAKDGLEITLMERLLNYPEKFSEICRMLEIQYRMHQNITKFSSEKFYHGKLLAHQSVEWHLLKDLPNVSTNDDTTVPLLLIDTAGCDCYELDLQYEISKGNEDEANVVAVHLKNLIESGVSQNDIAIITPYNLQVEILRSLVSSRYPDVEIKSVDGFQGREKEAVILSFVRSNGKGDVGFLAEDRRLNVSITRARRHLAVICDSETVSHHPFIKEFIDYMNKVGEVRSAHQYLEEIPNTSSHIAIVSKKISKSLAANVTKPRSMEVKGTTEKVTKAQKGLPIQPLEVSPREENMKLKYRTIIEEFHVSNSLTEHSFPASLNSFERRIIHEIAEKLGLLHTSTGEGEERHIIISKRSTKSIDKTGEKPSVNELRSLKVSTDLKVSLIVDEKTKSDNEEDTELMKQSVKPTRKIKKKKVVKPQENNELGNEEENFEAILKEFAKKDAQCNYKSCKTNVVLLFQMCTFCKVRFCLSHSLPEIHGCGDAAKIEARKNSLKEFERQKSTFGGKKSASRQTLEKKLDKKLDQLSSKRSRKPPNTK